MRLTWCSEIGVGGVLTFASVISGMVSAAYVSWPVTNIEKINAKSKMTQVSRPRIKLIAQFGVFSLKQVIYL